MLRESRGKPRADKPGGTPTPTLRETQVNHQVRG